MRPKYSQFSCVALAVWLMHHLEDRAPLRPPDQADMLTGRLNSTLANLAAVTLQTLRESSNLIGRPPPPFRSWARAPPPAATSATTVASCPTPGIGCSAPS
ncbi:hypothetical protein PG996_007776 [Apiospora saccharicola]|uniref:Uncharacterized protein n=1 Tax=Apiospora saccharicola TaxID=335842 RepID=A0ABR1UZ78_9PEZI